MTATERSVRAVVSGRVQGVGYRMGCARAADRLGVRGYVRNLADGRVEVVARGTPTAVEALLAWCGEGPPGAWVTEVRSMPVDLEEDDAGRKLVGTGGFAVR